MCGKWSCGFFHGDDGNRVVQESCGFGDVFKSLAVAVAVVVVDVVVVLVVVVVVCGCCCCFLSLILIGRC